MISLKYYLFKLFYFQRAHRHFSIQRCIYQKTKHKSIFHSNIGIKLFVSLQLKKKYVYIYTMYIYQYKFMVKIFMLLENILLYIIYDNCMYNFRKI